MKKLFFVITQFLLFIDSTKQKPVKYGIIAFKTIGKTIKRPIINTFGNKIRNSLNTFRRNKNTIKNVANGIQEKYLRIRHDVGSRHINFLKGAVITKVKYIVPQTVVLGKQLFMSGGKKKPQMNGKEISPPSKKSNLLVKGREVSSLINMANNIKPQLPFLFVTGGLRELTEFNLLPISEVPEKLAKDLNTKNTKLATFGGGCFWCVEACLLRVAGVIKVVNGYAGGTDKDPTYKTTCNGQNNNAEVVQITYDSDKITYKTILEAFFKSHDPTQKDRQGYDVGPQYRSIILHHDEQQKSDAENYMKEMDKSYVGGIITLLQKYDKFWLGEKYHQNYFALNPNQGYCKHIIQPKIEKFDKEFKQD